jgi:diaminopimelate epimerase
MSHTVPYVRLVGTGNDFVLIDTLRGAPAHRGDWASLARALCDPRGGEGTDGLLVLERSRRADVRMRIFNPDGSEPSMCGNGIRCLAWYAHASGATGRRLAVETRAGVKAASIEGPRAVRVNLGTPKHLRTFDRLFIWKGHPVDADLLDTGVPHLVCWVRDVAGLPVERLGRRLRHDPRLGRAGANVDFVRVIRARAGRATLAMRTFERGVEAETQACGTGSVAAAAAFARRALARSHGTGRRPFRVDVKVPGGRLQVRLTASQSGFGAAFLEGEARPVSAGLHRLNGRRGG